jgi:hypothetical protein
MVSAFLMLRRFLRVLRHARNEEGFVPVLSAGALLVALGTLAYAVGEGWNVVDAFYFAVATLTTTSVADPELVLESRWLKIFTVFYLLVGIGILVELIRRLGVAFVAVRELEKASDAVEATPAGPSGRAG